MLPQHKLPAGIVVYWHCIVINIVSKRVSPVEVCFVRHSRVKEEYDDFFQTQFGNVKQSNTLM